jgi:hypothetical protein
MQHGHVNVKCPANFLETSNDYFSIRFQFIFKSECRRDWNIQEYQYVISFRFLHRALWYTNVMRTNVHFLY